VGHGGTGDLEDSATSRDRDRRRKFNPDIGVLGIGGHWIMPKVDDPKGAPGVVGVAGGKSNAPNVPPFDHMRGVDVYGVSYVGNGMHAVGSLSDGSGLVAEGFFGVTTTGKSVGVVAFGDDVGVNGRPRTIRGGANGRPIRVLAEALGWLRWRHEAAVGFSTARHVAVAFRALPTVMSLTPISAAMARSDFSGFAAMAAAARAAASNWKLVASC
jgi:hypothetical protein